MAQSGYMFLEDGKWKVRYRIKDEVGKWRWAPLHVLGTKRGFPKRSDVKVAMGDFMAKQNKIGFRAETAVTVVDFVERVYHPAVKTVGMYFLQDSTRKGYLDIWNKHLKQRLQERLLRTFRPSDAESVMADLNEKHGDALAHGTYSNIKTAFSAIFTHAVRTGVIDANPVSPVTIPQGSPVGRACEAYTLGWMFPNRCGGVLDLDNFASRIIKPLLKKASLPWYGWQAYRRGLASNLKALGIDDMVIQRVLRHSDVSTTQRSYIRVRDEKMYDAMLQLGLAFDACTASVQPKDTPKSVN